MYTNKKDPINKVQIKPTKPHNTKNYFAMQIIDKGLIQTV